MNHHIDTLYETARHESARAPIWDELRQAQARAMPHCDEHPDRPAYGGYGRWQCLECIERTIAAREGSTR